MASEEEDIDAVALQAQIDLSLAATHNLVSSWMGKPATTQMSSKQLALETELKEYMKRPPRLGVGGSVSEAAQSSAREDARLRGQLMDKRARTDEPKAHSSIPADEEDNEGESRASAIRKKAKVDPFAIGGKKKKQVMDHAAQKNPDIAADTVSKPETLDANNESSRVSASIPPLSKHNVLNLDGLPAAGQGEEEGEDIVDSPSASPGKKKKRRRKKKRKQSMPNDPSS